MPAKENRVTSHANERIKISIQSLPPHRFLGIRNLEASSYFDFWEKQKSVPGLDCHSVVGLLDSIPSRNGQIGGWFYQNGCKGYLYGIEVPADYSGEVPNGMECTLIPASEYVVLHHPPYDFEQQEHEVCEALQTVMAAWVPGAHGYVFNDDLPTWQRHLPRASARPSAAPSCEHQDSKGPNKPQRKTACRGDRPF
jgi:predicted transcriptional regulator YdeE